jgi:hypothetical protein
MGYSKDGDEWYVDGDPNPYDYEEGARSADQEFWSDPQRYIAQSDPQYPTPDQSKATPPGRRDACAGCWVIEGDDGDGHAWIEGCSQCKQREDAQLVLWTTHRRGVSATGSLDWALSAVCIAAQLSKRCTLTPLPYDLYSVECPEGLDMPVGFIAIELNS